MKMQKEVNKKSCLPAGGSGVICRLSVCSVGDPFTRFPVPGPFFFKLVGLFLGGATVGCNASEQNIVLEQQIKFMLFK